MRTKYSKKILEQIKALLDNPGFTPLPKTDTGKAILHFRKNWRQATRFLESGELPVDNTIILSSAIYNPQDFLKPLFLEGFHIKF